MQVAVLAVCEAWVLMACAACRYLQQYVARMCSAAPQQVGTRSGRWRSVACAALVGCLGEVQLGQLARAAVLAGAWTLLLALPAAVKLAFDSYAANAVRRALVQCIQGCLT